MEPADTFTARQSCTATTTITTAVDVDGFESVVAVVTHVGGVPGVAAFPGITVSSIFHAVDRGITACRRRLYHCADRPKGWPWRHQWLDLQRAGGTVRGAILE